MTEESTPVAMGRAAGEAVQDLVTQHFPIIERIIEKSGKKQAVSVSLKFSPIGDQRYNLKTSIRYADKSSDEREDTVGGDPKQTKLGIEELKARARE